MTLVRELSKLDQFVLDFLEALDQEKIQYVLVSGYVALLFGRSRGTEDVDLLIQPITESQLNKLWNRLQEFQCINADGPRAFYAYLSNHTTVRFARRDRFIPNMELSLLVQNWSGTP